MKVLWLFYLVVVWISWQPAVAVATGGGEPAIAELRSVQADFVQVKHLKILARPLVSTGTFAFQVPQSLRWEYLQPVRSVLIMHNGAVHKFVEQNGELQEERGAQVGSLQIVLAEISNWLAGRFTDNAMFTVSSIDERTIRLTPKEQRLAALITGIEIEIGGGKRPARQRVDRRRTGLIYEDDLCQPQHQSTAAGDAVYRPMIRSFCVLLAALLLASCAPRAEHRLPELVDVQSDGRQQRCEAVFPAGSWQLVHSLEFSSAGGFAGTVIGVTVVDPPDLSCALVTVEGVTLFEATGGADEEVVVERAVPPFDRPGFAAGLLADVRSMFIAPPDQGVTFGLLPDGRPVCRYFAADGRVTDIAAADLMDIGGSGNMTPILV